MFLLSYSLHVVHLRTSPSHFCKQFQVNHYYCYLASSGVVIPHKLVAELFFEDFRLALALYTTICTYSSDWSRAYCAITRWRLTLSWHQIVIVKPSILYRRFAKNEVQKALARRISRLFVGVLFCTLLV